MAQRAERKTWWRVGLGILAGWGVLQVLASCLALLLPSTDPTGDSVGLGWLLVDLRESPDLASVIILPWLVIFLVGAVSRLWETHPDALRYFDGQGLRGWLRCVGLYVGAAVVAGFLEQILDFHFVPSIGIYCATGTLLLAACLGGVRRPFRHLSFDRPAARWADVSTVVLLCLAYVEFSFDAQLWDLDLEHFSATQWWLLQAGFTVFYLALAWAILHGSAVVWLGRVVRGLESRRRDLGGANAVASVWVGHVVGAGAVLAALILLGAWVEDLWRRDVWIFPQGAGRQVFLGVDWYFVSVTEGLRAAEVAIFFVLAATSAPLLPAAWRDRL